MSFLRDVPTLQVLILKQIANTPTKCIHEDGCLKLLDALEKGCFQGTDIVQKLVDYITIAGRMTDDAIPPVLLRQRSTLSLTNSKISGKYFLKVVGLSKKKLTALDASGCFQVDANIMRQCLRDCPALAHLNLRSCRKLTNNFMDVLIEGHAPHLLSLNIGGNYNINDDGISTLLSYSNSSNLQELILSGLTIRDTTLLDVAEQCTSLVSLGLGHLDLRESVLREVLGRLGGRLEKLDLSWLNTVVPCYVPPPNADIIIDLLVGQCLRLVDLDLSGNKGITASHLADLIERKNAQQQDGMMEGRMLEVLSVKFIGSPKATVESTVRIVYPYVKVIT